MPEVTSLANGTTARVAGAMAHELNNPLQGLMSALAATVREFSADERFVARLKQIEGGVSRVSRAVRSLASLHERMPREPESIDLASLVGGIRDALREREMSCQADNAILSPRAVRGYATELIQLTTEVTAALSGPRDEVRERIEVRDRETVLYYEWNLPRSAYPERRFTVGEQEGLSGLPVVLDEVAQLAGGRLDLIWIDDHITGIALVLINECER